MSNGYLNIPGLGSGGGGTWKAPVANFAALPAVGNTDGDTRITLDTYILYSWNGTSWEATEKDPLAIQIDGSNSPTANISWGGFALRDASFLESNAANPASTGAVRLGNNESISWRNIWNNVDAFIKLNASDKIEFSGTFNNNFASSLALLYGGAYGNSAILELTGTYSGTPGLGTKVISEGFFSRTYEIAHPGDYGHGLFLGTQGKVRFEDVDFSRIYSNTVYVTSGTNQSVLYIDNLLYADTAFVHGDIFDSVATTGAIRLQNNDSINWRNAANSANLGLTLNSSNRLSSTATTIVEPNKSIISDFGNAGSTLLSVADGVVPLAVFDDMTADAGTFLFGKNTRLNFCGFTGTYASPGYKSVNNSLANIHINTWNGTDVYTRETNRISFIASENHTATESGTDTVLSITKKGTTTRENALWISGTNRFDGTATPPSLLMASSGSSIVFNSDNTGDIGRYTTGGNQNGRPRNVYVGTDVIISNGIQIYEAANQRMGVATLVAGTVTVSNTSVTANTRIFLTHQNNSGTPGFVTVSARTASTSFTITSSNAADTSDIAWVLIEPAA